MKFISSLRSSVPFNVNMTFKISCNVLYPPMYPPTSCRLFLGKLLNIELKAPQGLLDLTTRQRPFPCPPNTSCHSQWRHLISDQGSARTVSGLRRFCTNFSHFLNLGLGAPQRLLELKMRLTYFLGIPDPSPNSYG